MKILNLAKLATMALAVVISTFGLGIGNTNALVITTGCTDVNTSCTVQELFDGGTITIDDKRFDNWGLLNLDSAATDLAQIDVIGLDDQPNNPGLKFNANGQLSVIDADFILFDFGFSVATLDGSPTIKDNSLELTGFDFGGDGGAIFIDEFITDSGGGSLAIKAVQADNGLGIFDLDDSAEFAPQSLINVEKNIFLFGELPGDTVELTMFEQRFSQVQVQVPEPTTLTLFAAGLAGFGWVARRCKKPA